MRSHVISVTAVLMVVVYLTNVVPPATAADQISDGQWYHQFLNTAQAHQLTQARGITVAVIDTGVDATHPDLVGSVLPGTDLTGEGQGDGHTDIDGHGTKMASLIVAHGQVRGVAPAAKILPIRAGTEDGARGDRVSVGIRWAVAHGARVISISIAGDDDLLQRQEVEAAIAADVVIVAGVGNRPKATSVQFPAAYPGVVAVAAVDKDGAHAPVSVVGPEVVVAAPGSEISGASNNGKYSIGSGTSNATAIVAGAAALVRAKYPQLKATEVIRRLTATATDKGSPGRDPEYGYGVLNLVGALTADLPVASDGPSAGSKRPGTGNGPAAPDGTPWLLLVILGAAAVALAVSVVAFVGWARRRSGVT